MQKISKKLQSIKSKSLHNRTIEEEYLLAEAEKGSHYVSIAVNHLKYRKLNLFLLTGPGIKRKGNL